MILELFYFSLETAKMHVSTTLVIIN